VRRRRRAAVDPRGCRASLRATARPQLSDAFIPSALVMMKNLTVKRFSNFNSATVRDPQKLRGALNFLQERIDNPLFRTKVGKTFSFDQIHEAMAYETAPGAKAVLLTKPVSA
jgi:NADPH2:quinone reductase